METRTVWSEQCLGFGLDDPGFESWQRHEIFLFSKTSREALGAHPHSHPIAVGILPKVKSSQGVMLTLTSI